MDHLLQLIEGIPPAKNLNRLHDVEKNIQAVKAEFVGKPLVCHELVKHIVYLRREIDVEYNTKRFYELLDTYFDEILEHYDMRWLLSICDTLVDIGDNTRSAAAMNVVLTVNYLNMMASLLDISVDGRPSLDKIKRAGKRPTHDGMISCDLFEGDMMYNMQKRLNAVLAKDELVNELWEEIKHRLVDDREVPTNWLASLNFDENKKAFYHDD